MRTIIAFCMFIVSSFIQGAAFADCPEHLNIEVRKLRSDKTINLCEAFSGKPMLVVNTASHCGFTPQFKGLEALHKEYIDRGLVVLGFPSDDFGQEDDDEEKTAQVCYIDYGVTFTMFSPIVVKGSAAHPLFKELAKQTKAPTWNFNKYVLDNKGNVVEHFSNFTSPESEDLRAAIESVL